MTLQLDPDITVFVVGAGIMGAGIAQVAAQAGHAVRLFDTRDGAAQAAVTKLAATLDGLAVKGKLDAGEAKAIAGRISAAARLDEAAGAGLVVEAIVENADAKRALFRALEPIVGDACVLASNTSSISITALANGLQRPGRVVGMHFFNPVPLMKLVEVVSGLQSDADAAAAIFDLARRWGKTPVHARSTPGFIVNRIARPYYAEALALLHEKLAEPATIDACLRGAGFRMGPCELMDLIGHDTNFAVTQSVFDANFGDKRYVPSLVQRELVDGGLLGRKSGRGFFAYGAAAPAAPAATPAFAAPAVPAGAIVALHGRGVIVDRWAARLEDAGVRFEADPESRWNGLQTDAGELHLTDGRAATQVAAEAGVRELAVFDLAVAPAGGAPGTPLAIAFAASASPAWREHAAEWLRIAGWQPQVVGDAPGLVVARTVAMLVNEGADAVHQGVCTPEGADLAMKLGVNYPAGPFEFLGRWDAGAVAALLDHLDAHYRGERYRVSPGLRERAWLALLDPPPA
ncbi:MAG TPA: 3-hydroxyacyl-CoA dehydrogenase [Caldimonas sp.]|jgi:3-hydroxybutyryl-CoA dehydrogenase|nr:3-hydroxyacyl-CoA dehydrogenase [Caldimonas sp.]HEV7575797.1 3-hydroxyacyl-CoA dehydrogenase [Caldimonas sp.]